MSIATSENTTDYQRLIENAFVVLDQMNPDFQALPPEVKEAALSNYSAEFHASLNSGLGLQDSLHNAGHAAFPQSPKLSRVLDGLMNNALAIAGEEKIDHRTCERDLGAEAEAHYAREMANYIATYACTGHSAMSPEDLKSVLEDMGVPENLQASVVQELETGYGMNVREPDPIAPAYMLYGLGSSDGVLSAAAMNPNIDLDQRWLQQVPQAPTPSMGLPA
jgi:hypothetical protein